MTPVSVLLEVKSVHIGKAGVAAQEYGSVSPQTPLRSQRQKPRMNICQLMGMETLTL